MHELFLVKRKWMALQNEKDRKFANYFFWLEEIGGHEYTNYFLVKRKWMALQNDKGRKFANYFFWLEEIGSHEYTNTRIIFS